MNTIGTNISNSTPAVTINHDEGFFKISGKSIPENPIKIYQPIMDSVKEYCLSPVDKTTVVLDFEYMNTSSSKWIFYILEQFEQLYIKKNKVEVSFYYEDESMLLTGRYLINNLVLPIDLIKK